MSPRKKAAGAGGRPAQEEYREDQTPSSGIFFKAGRVLYSGRSAHQKIEVIDNEAFGRVLFLDGLVQTTDRDEFFYHEMLAHPALTTHPGPRRLLIVGGGDGGLLHQSLAYPLERVVLCEIDPDVIEVSKAFFPWLEPGLRDGRVELVLADADDFIGRSKEKFDVILVDSSDPVGPSTVLHEEAFFRRLKTRLGAEGVLAAQAGSLLFHRDSFRRTGAFLSRLFRVARMYLGPVPTYPGGMWCYRYLAEGADPFRFFRQPPPGLRYYNREVHEAAFALPGLLREDLD
ncbi:MAG: polyamine aminopropyltransferase [Candidatus Aminicenantes bacterium]|nr:polyamine aminopropyltransferase [Candidatus Aminicenantes bacterium]